MREDNLLQIIKSTERDVAQLKSTQPVAPVDFLINRYSGTFTHSSGNYYFVFTPDQEFANILILFSYDAPSIVNYVYFAETHPTNTFYVDLTHVLGTNVNYYVQVNVVGTISFTTTMPT